MENVICTVVQEKTVEGFISVLNKYGVCTDYSNDYERSKAIKGIFVGVINKVYDVVWKGEGGHVEHDTLFMSAKCLISNKRESQPFRVGFVGSIVSQLVEINLKEGDAIAILKPKFFYALDVPTLCAGVGNVVAWVAKGLKDIESSEDLTKSSDENHCFESKNKRQSKATNNNRKRIPFIDEDSDSQTIGESSTSGTLQHDIQIYRSRPVELRPSSVPANNKLVPDSTTRSVLQRCQNNSSTENKSTPENLFAENIVSQNTANVGSTDVCCRNENHSNTICNLESAAKSLHKGLCSSFRNATNNTCGVHSHPTSCKTKCCSSRINCCNHAISANYLKENCCSCNNITPCACFNNQICSCARSICCGHNTLPQCMRWNSARSCHTNYSSCNRNVDHQCRSMKSCCGPCHTQIRQCCSTSHCQNSCIKLNHCHRQTNLEKTSISCCHKQITTPVHCHNNSLCCSNHEKINTCENGRAPHCCASKPESNSQQNKQDDFNEEISVELSEDILKKKRTNEWVHNLVGNLPELLKDIAASEPLETSSQSSSPDSRNNVMEASKSCSDQRHLLSSDQLLSCNPSEPISKNKPQNRILKKKKLFSPLDNSTIISARSVYCNSTIIEESTPFDSENQTDTPQEGGLSSDKNQKPKEKEANLPENINQDNPDSITTNDVNNVGERLCSEKNAQEPPIISQHQNKGALNVENRNSSEEQFPELRIETPIISETNDMNQRVSDVADLVEISSLMDNSDPNQHSEESTPAEKIGNDKESSFVKVCDGKNAQCQSSNVQDLAAGKNDQCQSSNVQDLATGKNDQCQSCNVQALATVNTNSKESSCNKSLALQDHSKAKVLSDDEGIDEWDMDVAPTSDKEGTKRSKESSDDTMELTSEATLMKRRKKEKYRKTRSVGSLCFGRNGDASPSNASSFHDAHSDGILSSFNSNRWCSKPVKEPSAPMSQEQKEKILAHCSAAYKLNLFSVITVRGAIINILPSLSEENYGNIVRGFCNEGCRKDYSYEEYNLMSQVCVDCNFCKYNFHLACPGCKEEGLRRPLCCYYKFEIHLYDGENVLRVEIDHRNGITFLGCTPQLYLVSKSVYNRLSRIIYSVTEDKEKDPILLKAKIKVMPKTGASVLTLHNTTLRHQLTFKGNYYRF